MNSSRNTTPAMRHLTTLRVRNQHTRILLSNNIHIPRTTRPTPTLINPIHSYISTHRPIKTQNNTLSLDNTQSHTNANSPPEYETNTINLELLNKRLALVEQLIDVST